MPTHDDQDRAAAILALPEARQHAAAAARLAADPGVSVAAARDVLQNDPSSRRGASQQPRAGLRRGDAAGSRFGRWSGTYCRPPRP